MSSVETVESYLLRSGLAHEPVDETTWVVQLEDARNSRIAVRVQEPIVLFTTPILTVAPESPDPQAFFRRLLELNAELLHGSYALEGEQVVLSGAQQLENLDLNEFQAVIDDLTMALDKHHPDLAEWLGTTAESSSGKN